MAHSMLRLARRFSTLPLKEVVVSEAKPSQPLGAEALKHKDYFGVQKLFTVKDLFNARVHLAHKEGTLNEHMKPYLFGSRLNHLIFDLDQTAEHLYRALNFVAHIAYRDGIILFVSKHRQTSYLVELAAKECGEYSQTRYFPANTLINPKQALHPKAPTPDLLIFLHTQDTVFSEHSAIQNASKMLIPTVAIVDTDCDPRIVTYPVPGNDDSPSAVDLYCQLFAKAVTLGKVKQKQDWTAS